MRKLMKLFMILSLISVFFLVGCSKDEPTSNVPTEEENAESPVDTGETPPVDSSGTDDTGTDASGNTDVEPATYTNMMSAVTGEVNANAKYLAYADVADQEGHPGIAKVFRTLADAELKHADDEFAIAQTFGTYERPVADPVNTGTTAENLQFGIDGETAEYQVMYPEFLQVATDESIAEAIGIFTLAMKAEEVHAGIYTDILENFDNFDSEKYGKLYRCPICGNIELAAPESCVICGATSDVFIEY